MFVWPEDREDFIVMGWGSNSMIALRPKCKNVSTIYLSAMRRTDIIRPVVESRVSCYNVLAWWGRLAKKHLNGIAWVGKYSKGHPVAILNDCP